MEYSFNSLDNKNILNLKGNILDGIQNAEVLSKVQELIENGDKLFVVKFIETKYINSTGLSLLINILTKARKSGGELVLTNVPDELIKLLNITKLNSIFVIRDSEDEAMAYLSESLV